MEDIVATISRWLLASLITATVFYLTLIVYRVYFSPLASIPGPRLAAATSWYEFYFDCVLPGQYVFEIERMHKEYGRFILQTFVNALYQMLMLSVGPIVRISPWEVHINDPGFFEKLYNVPTKLDKDPRYYRFINRPQASFGTIDSDLHRLRRGSLSKFFSSASISKIEPLLMNRVGLLCRRLEEHRQEKKPVTLSDAFRCLATDIVTEYAVPQAPTMLEYENFGAEFARFMRDMSHLAVWNRHFPFIIPLFELIPRPVVAKMDPGPGLAMFDAIEGHKKQAAMVVENKGASISPKKYPVVMNEVFNSDLPMQEKTKTRLFHEVTLVIGAGSESTGNTLAVTTYHILASPSRLSKLKEELSQVPRQHADEIISYKKLETLPYLGACINEGLRLGTGVSGRLPRVNRYQATKYQDYELPPGTAVSMSIRDMHYNPEIFPEPNAFKPERWLDPDNKRDLERYLVPFSRGSRGCVGKNLAMAELQMAIGNIFARCNMELFETGEKDVTMAHDFFAPFGPAGSAGLRVMVV
jgi:cytochrome P450